MYRCLSKDCSIEVTIRSQAVDRMSRVSNMRRQGRQTGYNGCGSSLAKKQSNVLANWPKISRPVRPS